jgi:hypothetical protein
MSTFRIIVPSLAVLALAAACSSGGSASAEPQGGNTSGGRPANGGGNRPGGMPGVNGKIAAIDGATIQVQGTTNQTAVTYSAATKFTDTVAGAKGDVVAGQCVSVRPASATPAPAADTAVTAGSVTVSAPVGGKCQGAGGFGPGGGRPSGRPSVRPSGRPGGGQRGGRGAGFGASGTVKTVTGTGFTVERTAPSGTATTVTVTITGTTTFAKTGAATKDALAVGKCVAAFGKTDDTGTVAATVIAVRPAENGECGLGFGGRGRGTDGGN